MTAIANVYNRMLNAQGALSHQRIGQYRVVRQIGEGGMGVVYEAVREDIGIRAAVKVLRPEFARHTEIAARFFNEARAANMIQHPGIVKVFDYGHIPSGEAYLAMEFVEGGSLRKRLEDEVRLNEVDSMRIARQIASALASAHAKMIVHREVLMIDSDCLRISGTPLHRRRHGYDIRPTDETWDNCTGET